MQTDATLGGNSIRHIQISSHNYNCLSSFTKFRKTFFKKI